MKTRLVVAGLVLACLSFVNLGIPAPAYGTSVFPTNPTPSSSTGFQIQLAATSATSLKCVRLQFDTQPDGSGGTPGGMNIASTALDTTQTDFLPSPASWVLNATQSTGVIALTNASGQVPNSGTRSLVLNNVVNPSAASSYWLLIKTFTAANCSSGLVDSLVVAYAVTNSTQVSVDVIPALTFTVNGRAAACNGQSPTTFSAASDSGQVSLGHIDRNSTGGGAQDLSVSTVGPGGFTVSINAPGAPNAMNDGHGHAIADIPGTHTFPGAPPFVGVEGFGYTADDAAIGFGVNQFAKLTAALDSVLYAAPGVVTKAGCVGFQAAASAATAPGTYTATVQYTAVPNF